MSKVTKDYVEKYLKEIFNSNQFSFIEKYVDEIFDIISNKPVKGFSINERILAITYYIIKRECLPLSVNLILYHVKISAINRILKKYNISIPFYNYEEKIERYINHLTKLNNNIEKYKDVIKIKCLKILNSQKSKTINELALICAVIFKLGITKESELCKITGLSDGTIRNYRRVLENLNVR